MVLTSLHMPEHLMVPDAIVDMDRGRWVPLVTPAAHRRFAHIMQLMDSRYHGLELGLEGWLAAKAAAGQQAELFGWCPEEGEPESALQVMALTSRRNAQGVREQPRVRMLGVAADLISPSQCRDADIEGWLARFLRLLQELLGSEVEFRAMRPKTMTWKPMERMHDFVRRGTVFDVIRDDKRSTYSATVVEEHDRGHTLYWTVRFSACPAV